MNRRLGIFIVTMIALSVSLRVFTRSTPFHSSFITRGKSTLGAMSELRISPPVMHPSFDILDDKYIEEYGLKATLYSHKKTGAEIVSVKAADENKVFGITFRTPPSDSTGIPHILEHSVLCGSKKFPVKEPFVELLKGSLQNFLNAFTYPDRTCYPVASTNTKDFYNLIHVYMDAVLHPRAVSDPKVFEQEGWHFELENPSDALTYKGVVYNEMKGVYSSQDSLLDRATQHALFPDNTYGVDSGGDPVVIPQLTFNQFQEFHRKFYHPSNSRIYFYGDDEVRPRLDVVDEYLSTFDNQKELANKDSKVHIQPKRLQPTRRQVLVPFAEGSTGKPACTVNWLMNDKRLTHKEALAIDILDHLLMGTPSSSLRKILTDSQLGESVTGGLSEELIQNTYTVGLKGVQEGKLEAVEQLILSSLKQLSTEGFHKDAIEASINTIEFRLREFNTGSFPRGLSVMLSMVSHWIYDQSPLTSISFEEPLNELKADLAANKPVFENMLREYFIDNNHRVTMEMVPDKEMEDKIVQAEQDQLAKIKESLSSEEINKIIQSTKELKAAQLAEDSPEAKATIPKLSLSDIDPKSREIPIHIDKSTSGVTVLTHELPSNGILYCDVVFDLSGIDFDDLSILPLFQRLITESGTKFNDDVSLSRKIGANTGGIWTGRLLDRKHSQGKVSNIKDDVLLYFMIQGKAVIEKIDTLYSLMNEMLLDTNLNNKQKATDILKESKIKKQNSVVSSGHSYASTRIAAKHTLVGAVSEKTGGLTSVRDASGLLYLAEHDWPALHARLEKLRKKFIGKGSIIINLTGDDKTLIKARESLSSMLNTLPALHDASNNKQKEVSMLEQWTKSHGDSVFVPKTNEGFIVPSQVNYVGKGGPIYSPGEKVSGASSVFTHYLGTGYLWDNVRVVGGAYGGFARFSETAGVWTYLSYRDPNLLSTLKVYDGTAASILKEENEMHPEELTQAVIGTVGDLDAPMTVDQKGVVSMSRFIRGEDANYRQQWRTEVLGTSAEDFKDIAKRLKNLEASGTAVVFGSQKALQDARYEAASLNLVVEPAYNDVLTETVGVDGSNEQ